MLKWTLTFNPQSTRMGIVSSAVPLKSMAAGGTVSLNEMGIDLSASTGGGQVKVGSSGITFADSSVQTTAASSGLSPSELYWTFVDHLDFYGSYCHIHRNASGGGSNFPRGFTLWSTEALTGQPVADYNSYRNEYDEVPTYVTNYGNYLEVGGFVSGTYNIKYANSGLKGA